MPFHGGAASIAMLSASNPASAASAAPWAAVFSATSRTSGAQPASKCLVSVGVKPTSTGCHTHTTKADRCGASWDAAPLIAHAASSDPSYANTTGPTDVPAFRCADVVVTSAWSSSAGDG